MNKTSVKDEVARNRGVFPMRYCIGALVLLLAGLESQAFGPRGVLVSTPGANVAFRPGFFGVQGSVQTFGAAPFHQGFAGNNFRFNSGFRPAFHAGFYGTSFANGYYTNPRFFNSNVSYFTTYAGYAPAYVPAYAPHYFTYQTAPPQPAVYYLLVPPPPSLQPAVVIPVPAQQQAPQPVQPNVVPGQAQPMEDPPPQAYAVPVQPRVVPGSALPQGDPGYAASYAAYSDPGDPGYAASYASYTATSSYGFFPRVFFDPRFVRHYNFTNHNRPFFTRDRVTHFTFRERFVPPPRPALRAAATAGRVAARVATLPARAAVAAAGAGFRRRF